MVRINRFDVCLINLDPTMGAEIQKTRPCVIISPDSMNHSRLQTLIIAPLTSTLRANFPTRINLHFADKDGQIALDQLRAVDRSRILKKIGMIANIKAKNEVLETLQELFS